METWKLDRIYSWLGAAIAYNTVKNRRFYFDFQDRVFFDLIEEDGKYFPLREKKFDSETEDLLISKIIKVIDREPTIIEIKKSERTFRNLFEQVSTKESYEKKDQEWKCLIQEITQFLSTNSIVVTETMLIE